MQLADIFVIVATVLAWGTLIPQILQLWRTGDSEGVSVTWPMVGFVSNAAWTTYLWAQGLWPAAVSTAGMLVFYVVVIRALHLAHASLKTPLVRGFAWALALTAIGLLFGWRALGLTLGWSYAIQTAPAVYSVYRSSNPTGVSVGSWGLITVEALLWGAYGWIVRDTPVVVYALTGFVSGILIISRAMSAQPSAVSTDDTVEVTAASDDRL